MNNIKYYLFRYELNKYMNLNKTNIINSVAFANYLGIDIYISNLEKYNSDYDIKIKSFCAIDNNGYDYICCNSNNSLEDETKNIFIGISYHLLNKLFKYTEEKGETIKILYEEDQIKEWKLIENLFYDENKKISSKIETDDSNQIYNYLKDIMLLEKNKTVNDIIEDYEFKKMIKKTKEK